MLASDLYAFRSQLEAQKVMLVYSGIVSEGVLFSLGEALRKRLERDEADRNLTKRVFSVFVEQVQNVIRYSDEVEQDGDLQRDAPSGMITVGRDDGRFFVVCANMLDRAKAPRLRERLEMLSGMDKDELKALYRQKIREEPEAESVGGTIGLIEIARRASAPLEFDFVDVDDKHTFYGLRVFI